MKPLAKVHPSISIIIPDPVEDNILDCMVRLIGESVQEILLVGASTHADVARPNQRLSSKIRCIPQHGCDESSVLQNAFMAVNGDIAIMLDIQGSSEPQEVASFVSQLLTGNKFADGENHPYSVPNDHKQYYSGKAS